ncbi:hypothetical protein CYLTODRAFT_488076 [Cylindrobasidium torrendii FP15055 ss-10]|uniref:Uncharacterized protein n=1 Tax=Cylindrobasidium torrendii FP15055 ss-10 TaxID=1314674 RepID=A0A0D7BIL3_9AGAR|nr:hypothetical protein CYLTODRAFT_488076 [Cylindrobasidium torrendii FP15055 ss-10]
MLRLEYPTARRGGPDGFDSASDDDGDYANFEHQRINWTVQIDALPVEILGEVFACFHDVTLPIAFDGYADDEEEDLPLRETEAQMSQRIFRKKFALQTLPTRVCQRWRFAFWRAGSCVWHRQCIYAPPARLEMTSSAKDAYWNFIETSISRAPKANVHLFVLTCDSRPEDEAKLAKNLARVLPYASKARFILLSPSQTLLPAFRGEIKQPFPGITSIAMDGQYQKDSDYTARRYYQDFANFFFDLLPNMDPVLLGDALSNIEPRQDHLRRLRTLRIYDLEAPLLNDMPLLEWLEVADLDTDIDYTIPSLLPGPTVAHNTLRSFVMRDCPLTDHFQYIRLPALRHLEIKRIAWPSDNDMPFIENNTFKLQTLVVQSKRITPVLLDVLMLHQKTITALHVHHPVTPVASANTLLAFIGVPHVLPGLQSLTLAFRPNPSQLKNLIALVQARGTLLRELTLKATGSNKNTKKDRTLETAVDVCRKAGCSVKVSNSLGGPYFETPRT